MRRALASTRINGAKADEIPKLTKGGVLVDLLVQATVKSVERPSNRFLFERMAAARVLLEGHITKLEKKANEHTAIPHNDGGRPKTKGWSVSRIERGRWRLQLSSPLKHIGIFKTKAIAEKKGREIAAGLKREA